MGTRMTAVSIAAVRGDDADDLAASYRVEATALAADVPDLPPLSRRAHTVGLQVPWPGSRALHWLARLDGEPVGRLGVNLPLLDNLENMDIELTVHPRFRRRGVGRALYAEAVRTARAEGRRRLFATTVESLPGGPVRSGAGPGFAAATGAVAANTEVRRRLDLAGLDPAGLDPVGLDPAGLARVGGATYDGLLAAAQARASGYSAVRWSDRAPDEYVDDVARLEARLMLDAPTGDLAWEAEVIDADRVRAGEAVRARRGIRTYFTGARHDRTGRLVALTSLFVFDGVPQHADQMITLVDPDHRGHRLGMMIKIENLRYTVAEQPAVRTVDTWNATTNNFMISINEAMGFRPVDAWVDWQVEV
ncbi:MAG TPA: GNAT family N-acetyltransferase [Micromonosporaceae bacterium]|nr:GNAT family N-acetyltransferase [Micromonosporaceae bacterium]